MDREAFGNCHHEHGGGIFMKGVFFGALLGGGAAFLLGTKRGRKILKVVSEEGLDNISELGGKMMDSVMGEREELADMTESDKVIREEAKKAANNLKSSAKRLFRGIRKKSSQ